MLPGLGQRAVYFSVKQIKTEIARRSLGIRESSLKVYLHGAVKQGLIHDAGRGWYSRLPEALALDPQPVQKLVRATKQALPLLDFCAWSTAQLNPWMHHLFAQPVAFLYVPREHLESVGETLRGLGWDAAVNPGKKEARRDVRPGDKMVVLRPTHAKQPPPDDHLAAPEQVLVEMLIEADESALMDGAESREVFMRSVESGRVRIAELKRFAEARYLEWDEIWTINQRHFQAEKDVG